MASSSSAQNPRHLLNHLYGGATSAPPPTPSSQPSFSSSDAAAADTLSRLLHRLPPSLSLPTRPSPRSATSSASSSPSPLPTVSLSSMSSLELGYFQLKTHSITPQLAESAESDAASLFGLPLEEKLSSFPKEWPLGFNYDDDDNEGDHQIGSFCLDAHSSAAGDDTTATGNKIGLKVAALNELTRELEKLGLEVVEKLACTVGFDNPFRESGVGPKYSSLMWVSSSDGDKGRRMYPYVVGLQYQTRPRKWDLLSDSGPVIVEPQIGSVFVTLGDIAQVWSNGKLKKVRGRAAPISNSEDQKSSIISITLLITLPLEATVSPLLTSLDDHDHDHDDPRLFNSFPFEDYAWRVYHDPLLTKDPLHRYRLLP